jgi:hypothetical protein
MLLVTITGGRDSLETEDYYWGAGTLTGALTIKVAETLIIDTGAIRGRQDSTEIPMSCIQTS